MSPTSTATLLHVHGINSASAFIRRCGEREVDTTRVPMYSTNYMHLSKICGIVVASQQGFASFEDLLHSPVLDHVVTIEKVPPTENFNYTTYRYLPALNNNFQNVRRHTRQKKSDICITDSSMEEQEGTINCKTEDLEEFFKEENSSSNSSQNGIDKLFRNEDSELKKDAKEFNKMRKNSEKLKGKNY
uniref:Uncharacterized protein n=1 Tax=Meloidogyne enterolobii TaxID=390850 RepID=A0A6V7UMR6_MELEN|nr:unnamed protein product [Meloidogyne enterolobii]